MAQGRTESGCAAKKVGKPLTPCIVFIAERYSLQFEKPSGVANAAQTVSMI